LHSLHSRLTDTSPPALIISPVTLSIPRTLFDRSLFIDDVTSSIIKFFIPVELVGRTQDSTDLSVGFCLLYNVSKCSFHLLIISYLSCKMLPCGSLTPNIFCGNMPHSSSIVLKIFRELRCLDACSTSEHLWATHWSLHCLAFLNFSGKIMEILSCFFVVKSDCLHFFPSVAQY
jgi:hypothetical protein